jgi:hypothetical protein
MASYHLVRLLEPGVTNYEQRNLYGKRIIVIFVYVSLAGKILNSSRKVLASVKSCATIQKSGSLNVVLDFYYSGDHNVNYRVSLCSWNRNWNSCVFRVDGKTGVHQQLILKI